MAELIVDVRGFELRLGDSFVDSETNAVTTILDIRMDFPSLARSDDNQGFTLRVADQSGFSYMIDHVEPFDVYHVEYPRIPFHWSKVSAGNLEKGMRILLERDVVFVDRVLGPESNGYVYFHWSTNDGKSGVASRLAKTPLLRAHI